MTQQLLDWTKQQDLAARDEGMSRSTAHANADHKAWAERAYAFLVRYCSRAAEFAGFEVIAAAYASGDVPRLQGKDAADRSPDKAWGSIFVRAGKNGLIRRIGYAAHPTRHHSPTPKWRSLIYNQEAA